ncbi:uncharacterized protein LOC112524857 [Cynara cardunculus var. scolymus]|uniref:uncharacterized protein LOC112524857 n=1 Tax=Cynara cardunculus var. scolymus TaxID=59895 RepID=UPI000D623B51|nr:uncharacterized protein LOC112524857 [Cynara cardunculus var. scolymus]
MSLLTEYCNCYAQWVRFWHYLQATSVKQPICFTGMGAMYLCITIWGANWKMQLRLLFICQHYKDPKTNSATIRKPWYQRAMEIASLWKITYPTSTPPPNPTLRKTLSTSTKVSATRNTTPNRQKLRKSTSLKVATSFTRVCLCVPISSYTEVFQADVPPRRSNTYPRSKPFPSCIQERPTARMSMEGRRIFRGKSLTDDVLMRRFVVEEEAMMQVRRRNEMEVIRKRHAKRRRRLGPSPLSRMVLAEEEEF